MAIVEGDRPDALFSKEVTIVAYLDIGDDEDWREFADRHYSSTDWHEKTERTSVTRHLTGGEFKKTLDEEQYDILSSMDIGDLELERDESVSSGYKRSMVTLSNRLVRSIKSEFPDEINQGWEKNYIWSRYEDGHEFPVEWENSHREEFGLLKHPSKMSADDMWSDKDANLKAVTFEVTVNEVKNHELEVVNNMIIKRAINWFKDQDWCSRVRWMDCSESKVKQGVCYDL